jgi:hypothetical protein
MNDKNMQQTTLQLGDILASILLFILGLLVLVAAGFMGLLYSIGGGIPLAVAGIALVILSLFLMTRTILGTLLILVVCLLFTL